MTRSILMAYSLDGLGGGQQQFSALQPALKPALKNSDPQNLNKTGDTQPTPGNSFTWIHLNIHHVQTAPWLLQELADVDPFVANALLAEETRPRMIAIKGGAMIVLRGVNFNDTETPEDMVSIRLWIDHHRIISLQKRQLKAVLDIEEKIKKGKGPKSPGHFIGMLTSLLFERMEPVLSGLDERTDTIEEQILENANTTLRENIIDIRKQAIMIRRHMAPQREAIAQIRLSEDLEWLSERDKRHLQENYNHVTRYVEDLDAIRERAQIVKDELANMLSDRLNKNMYMLSIVAAIFLPLGFLTGLLGINVGGIPGAENNDSFWIFCGILTVVVALQIYIFKKLKWF